MWHLGDHARPLVLCLSAAPYDRSKPITAYETIKYKEIIHLQTNRVLVNLPLTDPAVKGRSQAPGLIVLQVLRGRARQLEPF